MEEERHPSALLRAHCGKTHRQAFRDDDRWIAGASCLYPAIRRFQARCPSNCEKRPGSRMYMVGRYHAGREDCFQKLRQVFNARSDGNRANFGNAIPVGRPPFFICNGIHGFPALVGNAPSCSADIALDGTAAITPDRLLPNP